MSCGRCQDGWIFTDRFDGVSGAERCPCSVVAPPLIDNHRPTAEEFMIAVVRLAEIIPFFAESDYAKAIMVDELSRFVSSAYQLDWLVRQASARLKRATVAELRALFCTEYSPRDGIVTICDLPGMAQWELEAAAEREFVLAEAREREQEIALLPEARETRFHRKIRQLAAAKAIPAIPRQKLADGIEQPDERPDDQPPTEPIKLLERPKDRPVPAGVPWAQRSPAERQRLTEELERQVQEYERRKSEAS